MFTIYIMDYDIYESDEQRDLRLAVREEVVNNNPDLLFAWIRKYKLPKIKLPPPIVIQNPIGAQVPANTRSIYELTLTSPVDDPHFLRQKLDLICKSNMFEVISYIGAFELTQARLPHIHAILYSKRKFLDASKMKKMFPHRMEIKKVRDHQAYLNYIFKEKDNPDIIQYCQDKNVTQLFEENVET